MNSHAHWFRMLMHSGFIFISDFVTIDLGLIIDFNYFRQ
jgi:hypothetical protein